MTIETERLIFRPYCDGDFEFLASLLADPEVVRFIGNGQTRDLDGTKKFLEWIYSTYALGEDMGLMVLVRKDDNALIGHAGLVPQTIDGAEEIEVGYWIARDFWRQGCASEAALALREYGENQLGKTRLIALIQPGNIVSRKVATKIGMGLEKEVKLAGQDVYVYSTTG